MPAEKQFEIAVVGGGIAGLTLAIALHTRQIPVTVYEQAPKFGEIGAGVSFTPNAVEAMSKCHPGIRKAFEKVCTRNLWESKQKVWFDYLDGYDKSYPAGHHQEAAFTISNSLGQSGVHRAHFLEEMVKLIPQNIARFGKRLDTITENANGRLTMKFLDGTTAEADAVIGCDGIKSRVRQIIVGDHPSAYPRYSHKCAYRGLIPMEKAVEAVGEERAQNACMHMGPGGHLLTFPVNHGKILNIVAIRTDLDEWPDYQKLTRQGSRKELLEKYENYGPNVVRLLELTNEDLDVWALFDLWDNPPPTFYKGRICILGDAAHATTPHHGAGAGLCIEDSAVLAELLASERVRTSKDLEAVFATFDSTRRERGEFLVRSSRFIGDCYQWRAEGVGSDFKKIEHEINTRNGIIANVDVDRMCEEAVLELAGKLPYISSSL